MPATAGHGDCTMTRMSIVSVLYRCAPVNSLVKGHIAHRREIRKMKWKQISLLTLLALAGAGLIFTACEQNQQQPVANVDANANNTAVAEEEPPNDENEPWAKDNFDLQRVGNILERSKSPKEFESYLNADDGINNLDLNGDGYADYISVEEFGDRADGQAGLSLFSRYGPDLIQEVATILFYRDEPRYPGARVLVRGNDQIYGDNYNYEANWLDRSIGIVSALFGEHDRYRSPYYYDNYPSNYVTYEVVDTPYYRTRIERLYPQPVFVYMAAPAYLEKIKIKSPNNGLHLGQIRARLVKPTKDQIDFRRANPGRPGRVKNDKDTGSPGKSGEAPGRDKDKGQDRKGNADRGKPEKMEKQNGRPEKADNPGKGKAHDKGPGGGNGKGKP